MEDVEPKVVSLINHRGVEVRQERTEFPDFVDHEGVRYLRLSEASDYEVVYAEEQLRRPMDSSVVPVLERALADVG